MTVFIAIIALFVILSVSIVLFLNEFYYRRQVSSCGVVLLVCTVFLMWYFSGLSEQLVYLAKELGKYQQVDLTKGP